MQNNNSGLCNPMRILAFGELLWDMLPTGKKLGGAPINFSYHAQTLGAEVRSLTRIGDDPLGREIIERFQELGLSQELLQISSNAPTGTVDVVLDQKGTPSYHIVENVAWDEILINARILEQILDFLNAQASNTAFYFGSLALRSTNNQASIQQILQGLSAKVMKVCDLNLRAPFYNRKTIEFALNNADVFKLNDLEATELNALFSDRTPNYLSEIADVDGALSYAIRTNFEETKQILSKWAQNWINEFKLQNIVLTCGSEGAFLFNSQETVYTPSVEVDVKDTVGAGDSFAAVCAVGLLCKRPMTQIANAASKRAAFVCSQEGGAPKVPQQLRNPFGL